MKLGLICVGAAVALATAFAQTAPDSPGVTVELNGAPLMHRTGVRYPPQALTSGVQGTVIARVKLAANGEVVDASIVSGPEELRATVLQNVLNWHFSPRLGGTSREVSVTFQPPKQEPRTPGVVAGVLGGIVGSVPRGPANEPLNTPLRIKSIRVSGLSEAAQSELLSQLPVHEGDVLPQDGINRIQAAVRAFDEHLSFGISRGSDGESIFISAPGSSAASAQMATIPPPPPGTLAVAGNEQQKKLVSQTPPSYPPLAKQARISGVVHLLAIIGEDGTVRDLKVISGHPLMVQAAMDAVRTWVYQPTLLNGKPVPVQTQIDVNFTLAGQQQ